LDECGNRKGNGQDEEAAVDFGGVDAEKGDKDCDNAKRVVAEVSGFGVGIENQHGQEEKEEQKKSVAGESRLGLGSG